jgi:hypothetical protein
MGRAHTVEMKVLVAVSLMANEMWEMRAQVERLGEEMEAAKNTVEDYGKGLEALRASLEGPDLSVGGTD